MGSIYKISTTESDKVYIGLTTMKISLRWNKHMSGARKYIQWVNTKDGSIEPNGCVKLYKAMNKYGIDTFSIEVLEQVNDIEKLGDMEIYYIKKFDSISNGFNIQNGGFFPQHSEETKDKISKNTKLAILKNINSYRKYNKDSDLPVHCIHINIKNSQGFAINNHPKCKRKSFTERKYGSMEKAKEECLKFLKKLDSEQEPYKTPKKGVELPKGINSIKNGYSVRKIINGKLHYACFTDGEDIDKLNDAKMYLSRITSK